jgi:hypothetical protein
MIGALPLLSATAAFTTRSNSDRVREKNSPVPPGANSAAGPFSRLVRMLAR